MNETDRTGIDRRESWEIQEDMQRRQHNKKAGQGEKEYRTERDRDRIMEYEDRQVSNKKDRHKPAGIWRKSCMIWDIWRERHETGSVDLLVVFESDF